MSVIMTEQKKKSELFTIINVIAIFKDNIAPACFSNIVQLFTPKAPSHPLRFILKGSDLFSRT